ncbi:MAG TPA: tetratricopeptide repeat protein [Candidatus Dormibacteraeota bacterium]|nr:tetratricopeptide repeat protein [Candidatus Dormibacteraeota bacterium]
MTLRPGAVKQARQEAGLSLAQVGKGHVTAPAIYLIETGRTRPSLPTLEHIAHRTGKPVEFFLAEPGGTTDESQSKLLELESLYSLGDYDAAIKLGESMLELGSSAYRLGRIRFYLAMTYLQMGRPDRGAELLAEARSHFEQVNDPVMLVECMGAEAAVAQLKQRPDAPQVALEALEACRRLRPMPKTLESRLLFTVANTQLVSGKWQDAIKRYEEAIEAAGPVLDLRREAKVFHGLSWAYQELGQLDTAARYATRSVALLEILRDRVSLARSENNLGMVLMARGELGAAREHLDTAVRLADQTDLKVDLSPILASLCELCLQEGNVEQAQTFADQALEVAESQDEAIHVARAHMWRGRVADRRGDNETVDREFEVAISGLETLGVVDRLPDIHGMYAEILERRGELAKAYGHMKKALQESRPGLLSREPEEQEASTA